VLSVVPMASWAVAATAAAAPSSSAMAAAAVAAPTAAGVAVAISYIPGEASTITSADTTTFTVGQADSFTVAATGTPTPTFSLSGSVPTWLSIDAATGVLSGTPPVGAGGTDSFTVTASNGVTPDASQTFKLVVDESPSFANADTTTFMVDQAGLFQLDINGYPPGTVSETGTLPKGVSFLPSAALSGTPAAGSGGTYAITFTASNGITPDAVQHFTLVVDEAPTITSASATTFRAGDPGSFQVTATGYPAPTFTEIGVLPKGVTFSASGLLSDTPAKGTAGTYGIVISASNTFGATNHTATQAFTLRVLRELRPLPPAPPAPVDTSCTAGTSCASCASCAEAAITDLTGARHDHGSPWVPGLDRDRPGRADRGHRGAARRWCGAVAGRRAAAWAAPAASLRHRGTEAQRHAGTPAPSRDPRPPAQPGWCFLLPVVRTGASPLPASSCHPAQRRPERRCA